MNINFNRLANQRREKMFRQGLDVNVINWEHYIKVLEAKWQMLKNQ